MSILLPFVVAPAAVAIIFGSVFGDRYGLVNEVLQADRARPDRAGTSTRLASHVAIATMVNWRWTGYNALIFLAAMQAVPRDLYESAALDGAGRVRQFLSITLPMIRPTMIFVVITSTIGGLQIFAEPRLFDDTSGRNGGRDRQYRHPHDATSTTSAGSCATSAWPRPTAWLLFLMIMRRSRSSTSCSCRRVGSLGG